MKKIPGDKVILDKAKIKQRINEMIKTVKEAGLTTPLKEIKTPIQRRTFIGLFESDHDGLSSLPFRLAAFLGTRDTNSVICLEIPINSTIQLDGILKLHQVAKRNSIDLVYIDDRGFTKKGDNKAYFKKCYQSLSLQFKLQGGAAQAEDYIRNAIMTQAITAFTSAEYVFSVNGRMHRSDLLRQLSETGCFDVFISILVKHKSKEPLKLINKPDELGACLEIQGDELTPLTRGFADSLVKEIKVLRNQQLQNQPGKNAAAKEAIKTPAAPTYSLFAASLPATQSTNSREFKPG